MITERWEKFPVEKFSDLFEVSEYGNIRRKARITTSGRLIKSVNIKLWAHKKGYFRCVFKYNGRRYKFYIHRIVALAFLEPVYGKNHINHKDANKGNNHFSNLEWCTPAENNTHAFKLGLNIGRPKKIREVIL